MNIANVHSESRTEPRVLFKRTCIIRIRNEEFFINPKKYYYRENDILLWRNYIILSR